MSQSGIPTEVELAFELMPCQAARVAQEPGTSAHACAYFREWGTYHSIDYREPGAPAAHLVTRAVYLGRAHLVPEMLSGCRKAPILAVGINPNLPGWWKDLHSSLNPLFDDFRQYAHYFRYRRAAKPELSAADYAAFGGGPEDAPPAATGSLDVAADGEGKRTVEIRWRDQKMYLAYQALLDQLAADLGWPSGALSVGEDLSYANMVACPSARWTTRPDPADPRLPPMSPQQRRGIVSECFRERKYFLRQLFQSLPTVILVFSQNTASAFIGEMAGRFSAGDPKPDDTIASLMSRPVVLRFGEKADGTPIDAQILFGPHPTGDPGAWAVARPRVQEQLAGAARAGRLAFNPLTRRLARPVGSCVFCTLLDIGPCDYVSEITPLATPPGLAGAGAAATLSADKRVQTDLLTRFVRDLAPVEGAWEQTDDPGTAP